MTQWWLKAVSSAAVLLGSCTFTDGEPWGAVQPTLAVVASFAADRLTPDAKLKSAKNYALAIESASLDLGPLALLPKGEATATFDPSRPPSGCTLCHNGHCHCGDTLKSYEELALASGAASAAAFAVESIMPTVPFQATPQPVALAGCAAEHACTVGRGDLVAARLEIVALRASMRVFDLQQGTLARLPSSGVRVHVDLVLDVDVEQAMHLRFDDDSPANAAVDLLYRVPPSLFDGIDWLAVLAAAGWSPETPAEQIVDVSPVLGLAVALAEELAKGENLAISVKTP